MKEELQQKYTQLIHLISGNESVAVAYSGGVDSTLLLKVSHDILKDKAIGIYCDSVLQPSREKESSIRQAKEIGARLYILEGIDLEHEAFSKHPENRCYLCKGLIFDRILKKAREEGYSTIFDGSNADDLKDYRPGKKALSERGVKSPLQEAGLTKEDIRELSRFLGLSSWDKDALACLATRIPYHEAVTSDKLHIIDGIESLLVREGFRNVRARLLKEVVRIEVNAAQIPVLKEKIDGPFKQALQVYAGKREIILDEKGYQQGKMNNKIVS